MWNTPCGIRILKPEESRLFSAAADGLKNRIRQKDVLEDFPKAFVDLNESQQRAEIACVSEALLASPTVLTSNAVHDATVAAVFRHVLDEIAVEVSFRHLAPHQYGEHWRQLLWNTLRSLTDADNLHAAIYPTDVHCEDLDLWANAIELALDHILWDRDFAFADNFLDQDPHKAALMKQLLGIDHDYFSSAPEDTIN